MDPVRQELTGQTVQVLGAEVADRDDHTVGAGIGDDGRGVGDVAEPLHSPVPAGQAVARADDARDPEPELGMQIDEPVELVALVAGADHDHGAAEPARSPGPGEPRGVEAAERGEEEPGPGHGGDRLTEAEGQAEPRGEEQPEPGRDGRRTPETGGLDRRTATRDR